MFISRSASLRGFRRSSAPSDDGDEDEEEGNEDEVEEEDDGLFTAEDYFSGPKVETTPEDLEMQQILEANVDPKEWQLEMERVGPRLKFRPTPASKEWRTHIEQSGKHEKHISEIFPESKISLNKIGKELRAAVDRIGAKERNINKDFEHLGNDFREKQTKLDEVQEKYNKVSANVSELMTSLVEKNEQIELLKAQMGERNNSMTDNTPLRRINDALSELKKEVDAMELRIGVVAQTLMQSKLKVAAADAQKTRKFDAGRY